MALTMKSVEVFLFISTFLKNAMQNARDFALSTEGIYVLMHALPGWLNYLIDLALLLVTAYVYLVNNNCIIGTSKETDVIQVNKTFDYNVK